MYCGVARNFVPLFAITIWQNLKHATFFHLFKYDDINNYSMLLITKRTSTIFNLIIYIATATSTSLVHFLPPLATTESSS